VYFKSLRSFDLENNIFMKLEGISCYLYSLDEAVCMWRCLLSMECGATLRQWQNKNNKPILLRNYK
jgi:hypothetical protein